MQVGKVTYRNRIVSAPMAFGLIVQNPDARDFTYRKLEASAKGGNGCVIVGETDVNFVDAVRIPGFRPFDFAKPEEDPETFDAVGEYARRIKRHGAVALAELVHCGKEKVPFGPGQEAIGPIETTNLAGITPEETGAFVAMAEPYITSVHVTCGIYEASVKSGTESSMFHPHGLNIDNAAIIKKYTKLPVGAVGGINSPELCEQAIAEGKIDFAILGRQMLADPEFANKAKRGHEDQIRRCLRCYKCFPGSPEEGYDDLPFTSEELALYVGHCTINPLAHLPFDPDTLAPASKQETVLIVGGGAAGMQAAITACDRGQKVILAEQGPRLGGLLRFTDVDTDKPDLMNFKNLLVREVERRDIDVRLNTVITPENITSFGADGVIFATGSLPSCPPVPGIGHAHKAMDMYDGKVKPGHKIVMVGGGLVGCEAGLFLQKTGHEVTVVELLGRLANESFGMYREALIWEMEKCGMAMLPKTRCLEITPTGVKVENAGGVQTLEADTVLFALGMKSVDIAPLKAAAEAAGLKTWVIGDAIQPGKVDQATRSAYLAGIEVGR